MSANDLNTPGEEQPVISMSDGGSIRVKALFTGIKKNELDVSGRTMNIRGMKVPMGHFGSWVFRVLGSDSSDILIEMGGPAAAFVYALYRAYPEISVWMSDAADCSFTLEVEKEENSQISNEIGSGKMQENLQNVLSDIPGANLNLKMIAIVRDKSSSVAVKRGSKCQSMERNTQLSNQSKMSGSKKISVEDSLKLLKLKGDGESTQDKPEKLKIMAELAARSIEFGKFEENPTVVDDIKSLLNEAKVPQDDPQAVLENVRTVTHFLFCEERHVESAELMIASSNLIKQIENQEDRVEEITDTLKKTCELIAKIFRVKSDCINVCVRYEDEVDKPMRETGSGTAFGQAIREKRRGKKALKRRDFAEAIRYFDTAIRLQPSRMVFRLEKAEVFMAQGNYDECKRECEAVIRSKTSDKDKGRAEELLGDAELRSYNIMAAHTHFKEAVDRYQSANELKQETDNKFKRLQEYRLELLFDDYYDCGGYY